MLTFQVFKLSLGVGFVTPSWNTLPILRDHKIHQISGSETISRVTWTSAKKISHCTINLKLVLKNRNKNAIFRHTFA